MTTTYLDSTVITEAGEEVQLRQLCHGPTLCVFLRHWGCSECSMVLHHLEPRFSELVKLNVTIILIGLGSPEGIAAFKSKNRLHREDIIIVTNPTLTSHHEFGLQRGLLEVQGPRALFNRAKLKIQGFTNEDFGGDMLQQGGVALLSARHEEEWTHKNGHFGDILNPNQLVNAALRMTSRATLQKSEG